MGHIHCCGALHKSKSFVLVPEENYLSCEMDYLDECPVCGHTVLQVTRADSDGKVSVFRKVNSKALKLFEKLKSSILYEKGVYKNVTASKGTFYLHYNEFGTKKRCYSNLSTLKMGLFEDKDIFQKNNCLKV